MSSKAIFTSAPLARQQLTSDVFLQKGNAGEAPCSVSESRITAVTSFFKTGVHAVLAHLWVYIIAFITNTKIDTDDGPLTARNVLKSYATLRTLFAPPTIVVTFPQGTKSEDRESRLGEMGFTKGSLQRYVFYKGKADKKAIGELITMGASADCHAPPGSCNIKGFAALDIINKVLHAALGFLSNWDSEMTVDFHPKVEEDDEEFYRYSDESWHEYAITSASDAVKGHIFPYFDGLCLPDKSLTPRVFTRLFSNLFGSTGAEIASGLSTFYEGWSSLANSPAGLAISHLFLGIELVTSVPGIRLRPIFLGNVYRGFALQGSCAIFKGHVKYLPITKEEMADEILRMDRHKAALSEIATILSTLSLRSNKDTKETLLPEHLTSQRAIHNYMRARTIPNDTSKELSVAINRTEFREDYWDVTDRGKIARAIHLLVGSEWPGDDVPFALKSNAMFTTDRVYSILAAFGLRAPSILGVGNNISFPITAKGKFYEDLKGVSLPGVPIFYKNLQAAFEDWTDVLKNRVIYFKHGGNDKHGVGRITALGCWVPKDSSQGKQIINNLTTIARVEKRKERERDEKEEGGSNRDKRIRRTVDDKDSILALMTFDGDMPSGETGTTAAAEMEVDEF